MAISTKSVIHYTKKIDNLKGILSEGFKLKYCAEKLILKSNGTTENSYAAHPMICFCDIPLSMVMDHVIKYGSYGIGMTKQWAKTNGLNPVLYINTDSHIAKHISNLIVQRRGKSSENLLNNDVRTNISRIKAYAKNHTGKLYRNGRLENKEYVFYDEREWRLVPEKAALKGLPISVGLKNFKSDKEEYNSKLEPFKITFTHNDISYIIVEKTSEIPEIIKFIREKFSKLKVLDLDILISKVCSTEQILSDY